MAAGRSEELKTLQEILKWIKFQAKPGLKDLIIKTLETPVKMVVYELSDGVRSTREIATKVPVSYSVIAGYWRSWLRVGIVEESENYVGRCRHICSLEEVGLTVPELELPKEPTKEAEQNKESETKVTDTVTKAGTQ